MFGTKVHKAVEAAQVLGHTHSTFYDYHMTLIFIHFLYFIADYNNDTLNTSSTLHDKGKS